MANQSSHRLLAASLTAALAAASLALGACGGGGGGTPDPAQAAAGEKVFMTTCATCHGKDAMGLPHLGKQLVNNQFVQSQGDDQLVAFVEHGRPSSDPANTTHVDMPPKGGNPALSEQDIRNVVAYLRLLQ